MRIKKLCIKNFRLFSDEEEFVIDGINTPNGEEGSGLTVFIGENGCGKTSLLDALALPFLEYKTESISIDDFFNPSNQILIQAFSVEKFTVASTMPKGDFEAVGQQFESGVRARGNKAYLSSVVVTDQKYIKPEGAEKPKDYSPNLRVNVNNPFKGKRYDENDFLYLDKNRTFQIRSGTYNSTRFDRLMGDFDYQYVKQHEDIPNHDEYFDKEIKSHINHEYLAKAVKKFQDLSGLEIKLELFDNWRPFKTGFFAERKDNNLQVQLGKQGSGYEMVFSLIYSFYLAEQSGKDLIALIDEPELHLHPQMQKRFVKFLIEASKQAQILLTTHSPLLVKQLLSYKNVKTYILTKTGPSVELQETGKFALPYISANEVNFKAFDVLTPEFHNELYGHLQELSEQYSPKDFDNWLKDEQGIEKYKSWIQLRNGKEMDPYDVTLHTYIRHSIHHPENVLNEPYSDEELKESCEELINILNETDE